MPSVKEAEERHYVFGTENNLGESYVVNLAVFNDTDKPLTDLARYYITMTVMAGEAQGNVVREDAVKPDVVHDVKIDGSSLIHKLTRDQAWRPVEVTKVDNQSETFNLGQTLDGEGIVYNTLHTYAMTIETSNDEGRTWDLMRDGYVVIQLGHRTYQDEDGNNQVQFAILVSYANENLADNDNFPPQFNLAKWIKILFAIKDRKKMRV